MLALIEKLDLIDQTIMVELILNLKPLIALRSYHVATLNHKTVVSSISWINEAPSQLLLVTVDILDLIAVSIEENRFGQIRLSRAIAQPVVSK